MASFVNQRWRGACHQTGQRVQVCRQELRRSVASWRRGSRQSLCAPRVEKCPLDQFGIAPRPPSESCRWPHAASLGRGARLLRRGGPCRAHALVRFQTLSGVELLESWVSSRLVDVSFGASCWASADDAISLTTLDMNDVQQPVAQGCPDNNGSVRAGTIIQVHGGGIREDGRGLSKGDAMLDKV